MILMGSVTQATQTLSSDVEDALVSNQGTELVAFADVWAEQDLSEMPAPSALRGSDSSENDLPNPDLAAADDSHESPVVSDQDGEVGDLIQKSKTIVTKGHDLIDATQPQLMESGTDTEPLKTEDSIAKNIVLAGREAEPHLADRSPLAVADEVAKGAPTVIDPKALPTAEHKVAREPQNAANLQRIETEMRGKAAATDFDMHPAQFANMRVSAAKDGVTAGPLSPQVLGQTTNTLALDRDVGLLDRSILADKRDWVPVSADSPRVSNNPAQVTGVAKMPHNSSSPSLVTAGQTMKSMMAAASDGEVRAPKNWEPHSHPDNVILQSTTSTSSTQFAPHQQRVPMAAVAQQLIAAVAQSQGGTVQVSLNPEELGIVRISVSQGDAGPLISLFAERPETNDLLRRNIDSLMQEFADMGYDNPSFSFDQNSEDSDASSPSSQVSAPPVIDADQDMTTQPMTSITLVSGGLDLKL